MPGTCTVPHIGSIVFGRKCRSEQLIIRAEGFIANQQVPGIPRRKQLSMIGVIINIHYMRLNGWRSQSGGLRTLRLGPEPHNACDNWAPNSGEPVRRAIIESIRARWIS